MCNQILTAFSAAALLALLPAAQVSTAAAQEASQQSKKEMNISALTKEVGIWRFRLTCGRLGVSEASGAVVTEDAATGFSLSERWTD